MSKKPVDKKRYHDETFTVEALRILAASGRKIDEVAEQGDCMNRRVTV